MSFGQLMGGKAWLGRVPEAAMKQTQEVQKFLSRSFATK